MMLGLCVCKKSSHFISHMWNMIFIRSVSDRTEYIGTRSLEVNTHWPAAERTHTIERRPVKLFTISAEK